MYRYILKRLLLVLPVLLGVSFIVYVALDLAPGDIVDMIAPENATIEEKEQMREEMGLNRNIIVRYADYMGDLLHGDMGTSYTTGEPVWDMFMQKAPNTLKLGFVSVLLAVVLSLPLGIYAALHRGTWKDNLSMVLALTGLSMPNFWLGLLLIVLFSVKLKWLPSGGDEGLLCLILPAITVGTGMMATMTRTTRSSMLDVIRQDYLRTARAKGVPEREVISKHALKNALIPIITIVGTQLGAVMGGAVLTETVFSWNGVGRLIVEHMNSRDIPVVTGSIIMTTMFLCLVLLAVDLLYAVVDPRIKAQYSGGKGKKKDGKK